MSDFQARMLLARICRVNPGAVLHTWINSSTDDEGFSVSLRNGYGLEFEMPSYPHLTDKALAKWVQRFASSRTDADMLAVW